MVVVLPAPFGPRKPVTLPGTTSNDKLLTASFSPYRLLSPRTSIIRMSPLWRHISESAPARPTKPITSTLRLDERRADDWLSAGRGLPELVLPEAGRTARACRLIEYPGA